MSTDNPTFRIINNANLGNRAAYGAYFLIASSSDSAELKASGNTANLVYGSRSRGFYGAYAEKKSLADGVSVAVSGNHADVGALGQATSVYGGAASVISDYATSTALSNTVAVSGMATQVFGGLADTSSSNFATATAERNTVTVSGTAGNVFGGYATGENGTGQADKNEVVVSGSVASVTGGLAAISYGADGKAYASGNVVTVTSGAIVGGNVTGGTAEGRALETATGNTVNILGGDFDPGSLLKGGSGSSFSPSVRDLFTGNTLNFRAAGVTVGGVENFQKLNFHVPAALPAGAPLLEISPGGEARLVDAQGNQSSVTVSFDGAIEPLTPGQSFILIQTAPGKLVGTPDPLASGATVTPGVTLEYGIVIAADGAAGLLTATVASAGPNARSKSLSEGLLSGLALASQGADLVSGQGMEAAVSAARRAALEGERPGFGVSAFASASAGRSRYDTGSHLDVSGTVLAAGIAVGIGLAPGTLTLAPFVEYGSGSYDAYNAFPSSAPVRGSGDVRHAGGGIMARMDFDGPGPGGAYLEASGRAGRVRTDYASGDLRNAAGVAASYEHSSAYYGAHAGIGYVWDVSGEATLDVYAKYVWTRQEGGTLKLSTGETVDFEDADSSRVRAGWRLAYAFSPRASLYAGAAYEHEADGEMAAFSYGYAMRRPSLRGGTGIGELGASFAPSDSVPLSIELGAKGYAGQRKGFSGAVTVRVDF